MDGAPACPFVAFGDDRDGRSTSPDHRHRCFAESPPAPRALAHQEAYCLSSAFPVCPTFQDWARREAAHARGGGERAETAPTAVPTAPATAGRPPLSSGAAGDPTPGRRRRRLRSRRTRRRAAEPPVRRNPPRDWAAPPPWASGAAAASRAGGAGPQPDVASEFLAGTSGRGPGARRQSGRPPGRRAAAAVGGSPATGPSAGRLRRRRSGALAGASAASGGGAGAAAVRGRAGRLVGVGRRDRRRRHPTTTSRGSSSRGVAGDRGAPGSAQRPPPPQARRDRRLPTLDADRSPAGRQLDPAERRHHPGAAVGADAPLRGLSDDQDPVRRARACHGSRSWSAPWRSRRSRCSCCRRCSGSVAGEHVEPEPERQRARGPPRASPRPCRPQPTPLIYVIKQGDTLSEGGEEVQRDARGPAGREQGHDHEPEQDRHRRPDHHPDPGAGRVRGAVGGPGGIGDAVGSAEFALGALGRTRAPASAARC